MLFLQTQISGSRKSVLPKAEEEKCHGDKECQGAVTGAALGAPDSTRKTVIRNQDTEISLPGMVGADGLGMRRDKLWDLSPWKRSLLCLLCGSGHRAAPQSIQDW